MPVFFGTSTDMPANLTPQYKKAEELYRQATTAEEKLAALELMMQTIPKHKGTEHIRAELKRKMSQLREAPVSKGAGRHADLFHIPKGAAAGQVVLLGTPNSGKSSLVGAMTQAAVHIAEFPFSTHAPVPGIMHHEDVPIELVDMPPITAEHVEPGQVGAYRHSDLILVTVDLSADSEGEMETCVRFLQDRMLLAADGEDPQEDMIRRQMVRPCFCVCTKADLAKPGDFEVFAELFGKHMPMMAVSVKDSESLKRMGRRIFEELRVVRIYSKLPGKEPDKHEPFTLPAGSTVHDLAYRIHRELADKLRFARIWGEGKYAGQQVPRDYILQDKDILELHFQ